MHEINWRGGSSLKLFNFMEVPVSRHKRSKSDPFKRKAGEDKLNSVLEASCPFKLTEMGELKPSIETKKSQPPKIEFQNSLKQEIMLLQERLKDQFVVRRALENALSYRPFLHDTTNEMSIPKAAKELIKETAVLEMEVAHLEKYLLSLYRKTFTQKISPQATEEEISKSSSMRHKENFLGIPSHNITSIKENADIEVPQISNGDPYKESNGAWGQAKLFDSTIHRSHSSLSNHSANSIRTPPSGSTSRAVDTYHSLPLSMLEQAQMNTSNITSLAEHFKSRVSDHVLETPNWLSEEMIRCMSAIYCEIADPPLANHDCPFSPNSCSSSIDACSPLRLGDAWSPQCGRFSSFNSHFENPFQIGECKEVNGPYCTMAKVQWICRDNHKLRDIEHKLQNYRSLVYRLEGVDPRRLKHEEKLAFWINVHNALVMHAFLVYGIPQSNLKRMSLLLKAAYNIGSHTISVDVIQSVILRCRLPHPGQWLRLLFSSKTKFKTGDARKAYAVEHSESRLYFALCSGSYSDPAVRVYTPKRVFQDLEAAKEEYIQSNLIINKDQKKVLLPKLVESFAKDSDLCPGGLMQMIEPLMPDSARKNIPRFLHKKFAKSFEWIPHNFVFCYLLAKELS